MKTATIYKITNKKNGNVYIGSTKYNIDERLKGHFKAARRGVSVNPMHEDMRKQSVEDFQIEELINVSDDIRWDTEAVYTRVYKRYGKCYNIAEGTTPSTETRKKMSASQKGHNYGMFGKQHSDETKKKMSIAKQNVSDETKKKISSSLKGKTFSEEHKARLSEAIKLAWAKRRLEKQNENQVR